VARSEQKRMVEQFGEKYRAYQQQVPMFFPPVSQWRQFVKRKG